MSNAKHTPDSVRAAIEASVVLYRQSVSGFSWPDDHCLREPWSYDIHMGWVGAWNAEGRQTECVAFLRKWLENDENILAAFDRAAAFANGTPPGSPTRPGQHTLHLDAAAARAAIAKAEATNG